VFCFVCKVGYDCRLSTSSSDTLTEGNDSEYLTFMGPCILRIFYYISNKMQRYTVYFIWKLLCMFRVVAPPNIRSANNYLQHLVCVTPLLLPAAIAADSSNGVTNTRCLDTVVCAPDVGWWYRPKHVEQFPDKINCVTFHLVGYILE
jgi:hypothetical protein